MPLKDIGGFQFKACPNVKHSQNDDDSMKIKLGASIFDMLHNLKVLLNVFKSEQ
jgi:hypothetical protein